MPRVVNRRTEPTEPGVYVGRPSLWGNPFYIGKDGTRTEVIAKYRTWLLDPHQAWLVNKARIELKGQNLICWCAPRRCHADVLLEIANAQAQ